MGDVAAHGGGTPVLVNKPAGPYVLSLWLAPDPLRIGTVHATVAVSEPGQDGGAGEPVLGAAVRLVMTPEGDSAATAVGALATHQNAAIRLFYEADMEITEPGNWLVAVVVDGPAGHGESTLTVRILPAASASRPILGAAGLGLLVGAAWLLARRRRNRRHSVPAPEGSRSRKEHRQGGDAFAKR